MKPFLVFIISILITCISFSQQNNFEKYFPLKVGNVWVYYCVTWDDGFPSSYDRARIQIVDTVTSLGKKYYQYSRSMHRISGTRPFQPGLFTFAAASSNLRVDSITGNIYYYVGNFNCYSPNEFVIDSLNAKLHDTEKISCSIAPFYQAPYTLTCIDTVYKKRFRTVFGIITTERRYEVNTGLAYSLFYYVAGSYYRYEQTLIGRVIDGVAYGDTAFYSLLGINQLSSEIPDNFSLSQNHPNPFNPVTKIRFDIPKVGNDRDRSVTIIVYDLLGREAVVLVNEELNPGIYEVNFDGSNLPSGVYYYRLNAGSYSQTKKMVLLK